MADILDGMANSTTSTWVNTGVSPVFVGRETELSLLDVFLASIDDGFAVLALEGEPGIGKTTVWHEGIRRAQARGLLTLSCRPAESDGLR